MDLRKFLIELVLSDPRPLSWIADTCDIEYGTLLNITNGRRRMGMIVAERLIEHYKVKFEIRKDAQCQT